METCRRNLPPEVARRRDTTYLLEQILIAETVSIGTNLTVTFGKNRSELSDAWRDGDGLADSLFSVVSTGARVIDWKHMTTDMAMAAIWTTVGTRSIMSSPAFYLRWIKMAGWNQAKGALDATIYYLTPVEGHDPDIERATLRRAEFSALWGVGNAITPVTLYTVLSGLECLYPGAQMRRISRGVRLGVQTGTSLLYFTLRGQWMGR
jgi:hypothetical protein